MPDDISLKNDQLADTLVGILGSDNVLADDASRDFYSSDVYTKGAQCALAITPEDTESLSKAVAAATSAGYAVIGRGGGMSYTGGYVPVREDTVTVDTRKMNRILEINADDMYITVQAGVTWKQIYEALTPLGLRIPFFGTFSGAKATVGGGLSNGALFFGTARYGTAADNVLGLEVIAADGSVIKTGQAAHNNAKPHHRTYGPDFTGLFCHDAGALGIKTQASFQLMEWPKEHGFLSFVFPDLDATTEALSAVARSGAAEEAYVFDPGTTKKNLGDPDILNDIKALAGVIKGQSSLFKGLVEGAKLAAAGRDFVPPEKFSMHIVCSGRCAAAVEADMEEIRKRVAKHSGEEIPNSIPKAARGSMFPHLNGVIGGDGERWAALNAKVPHSAAVEVNRRVEEIKAKHKAEMDEAGVWMTLLNIAINAHSYSIEPVFRWYDEWHPVHKLTPEPSYLKKLTEPPPNPKAREVITKVRNEIVDYFAEIGASSNQIGKTYKYAETLHPNTRQLLDTIKHHMDPDGQINPSVLGLG